VEEPAALDGEFGTNIPLPNTHVKLFAATFISFRSYLKLKLLLLLLLLLLFFQNI